MKYGDRDELDFKVYVQNIEANLLECGDKIRGIGSDEWDTFLIVEVCDS